MNFNSVTIGVSQGLGLVDQRQQKLAELQRKQEAHNMRMQQDKQQQDLVAQQLEQHKLAIRATRQELSKRDMIEALKVASHQNDSTLLKRWILNDPEAKELFEQPVDFKVAKQTTDLDGLEDEILDDAGFDAPTISKMSKEDKLKAIKKFGDDVYIITKADGSKEVMGRDDLAAATGFTEYLSEKDKQEYAKAALAGGLKRAYAMALAKGDDKMANKYRFALLETSKDSGKTSAPKPTAAYKNARTIVLAENPELANDPTALDQAIGKYMADDNKPAFEKKVDTVADQFAYASQVYDKVTSGSADISSIDPTKLRKAYAYEVEQLKNDKRWSSVMPTVEDKIQAIENFGDVTKQILKADTPKHALTSLTDWFSRKVPKDNKPLLDAGLTPGDIDATNASIREYVDRMRIEGSARLATLALIKAMSGLAVTDEERKIYDKLMGLMSTDDIHVMLINSQNFIRQYGTALDSLADRLSKQYPATALQIKTDLSRTKQLITRDATEHIANTKADVEKGLANLEHAMEIFE